MIFLGSYNKDAEKRKERFNSLIKNEDAGEVRDSKDYGDTRTIYTLNDKGDGLFLYHYYPIVQKLYQYRKECMEAYDNLIISAVFSLRDDKILRKYGSEVTICAKNIKEVLEYQNAYGFFIHRKELLEKFYKGELSGIYRLFTYANRKFQSDTSGFRAFFPNKIKAIKETKYYTTEQVIRVPDSVRILDYLVNGDLEKYTSSSNMSQKQLSCFEFNPEPYDEINFDLLNDIYGKMDEDSLYDNRDVVVNYAINQAEANGELLRLAKRK